MDNYIRERDTKSQKVGDMPSSDSFVDQLAQEASSHTVLRDQLLNNIARRTRYHSLLSIMDNVCKPVDVLMY